jgi:hypothetical protein
VDCTSSTTNPNCVDAEARQCEVLDGEPDTMRLAVMGNDYAGGQGRNMLLSYKTYYLDDDERIDFAAYIYGGQAALCSEDYGGWGRWLAGKIEMHYDPDAFGGECPRAIARR